MHPVSLVPLMSGGLQQDHCWAAGVPLKGQLLHGVDAHLQRNRQLPKGDGATV